MPGNTVVQKLDRAIELVAVMAPFFVIFFGETKNVKMLTG